MVSLHGRLFLVTRIYPCPELLLWGSTKANSCEMSQSVRGETVSSTPLNDLGQNPWNHEKGCWPKSGFLWISHPSPHKNYKVTKMKYTCIHQISIFQPGCSTDSLILIHFAEHWISGKIFGWVFGPLSQQKTHGKFGQIHRSKKSASSKIDTSAEEFYNIFQ